MPERGEVWLANLNPRRGTEPGKTLPVLIVQAQALLDAGHPSTLIIPLTTNLIDDAEPLRIRVPARATSGGSSKVRSPASPRRAWRASPPRSARCLTSAE